MCTNFASANMRRMFDRASPAIAIVCQRNVGCYSTVSRSRTWRSKSSALEAWVLLRDLALDGGGRRSTFLTDQRGKRIRPRGLCRKEYLPESWGEGRKRMSADAVRERSFSWMD